MPHNVCINYQQLLQQCILLFLQLRHAFIQSLLFLVQFQNLFYRIVIYNMISINLSNITTTFLKGIILNNHRYRVFFQYPNKSGSHIQSFGKFFDHIIINNFFLLISRDLGLADPHQWLKHPA